MAAEVQSIPRALMGIPSQQGTSRAVVTANETNQLKTGPGILHSIQGFVVGTTWVVDVYDATAGTSNPISKWVTADGKGLMRLDIPFGTGLRVISSGTTPGSLVLVFS